MFYVVDNLERTIVVNPRYSAKTLDELHEFVKLKGYMEIEGTFDPQCGYIIVFVKYNFISKEVHINRISGMLEFKVTATVVCQKPIKGEIVDVVVRAVFKEYVVARFCGFIDVVVQASEFAAVEYAFMKEEDNPKQGYFHSHSDPAKHIRLNTVIRVKFVECNLGSGGYFLKATMYDGHPNYLGVVVEKEKPSVEASDQQPSVKASDQQPSVKASDQQPSVKASDQQPNVEPMDQQPSIKASDQQPNVEPMNQQPCAVEQKNSVECK